MDRTIYLGRGAENEVYDDPGQELPSTPAVDPAEPILAVRGGTALEGTKLVERPEDMARLLLATSPRQAASFALAAHERACWAHGVERAEFWSAVIELLGYTGPQARDRPSHATVEFQS